jgi:anti-sigma factor RsiW
MGCNEFQPALSEFLDGTLSREARARLESHLGGCADCRALLADLRRVKESARSLPKMAPPESVWQKVRADFEVETGRRQRPVMTTAAAGSPSAASRPGTVLRFVPTRRAVLAGLAAAAVVALAASTGIYYMTRPAAPVATTAAHADGAPTVQSVEAEFNLAAQHYEKAIADMEKITKDGQAALDPQTAAVLQKSLGLIDQAIRDSGAALRTQPTSEVARASLFEALQRKVGLLRDTIALINEMRKGDQAGTAKIVGALGKG